MFAITEGLVRGISTGAVVIGLSFGEFDCGWFVVCYGWFVHDIDYGYLLSRLRNLARASQRRKADMSEMKIRIGSNTAVPPLMKTFTAMMPITIGPSTSSPQFLVLGMATKIAPTISNTLMNLRNPVMKMAPKNIAGGVPASGPGGDGRNGKKKLIPNVKNARPSSAPTMLGICFIFF